LKKYYYYLIVGLLCSVLSFSVVAAPLKIGFVNIVKVMDKAPQVKSANKRLEKELAPRQRRLVNAQKSLRRKEERLAKNAVTMSEKQVRKLSREIRDKKRELARQQEEFREDYNIRRNEELDRIHKIIIQVIQALGKESRYDLILSDGVVFWNKRIDITDKVLRRLRSNKSRRRK
jgi:outer membrane protein